MSEQKHPGTLQEAKEIVAKKYLYFDWLNLEEKLKLGIYSFDTKIAVYYDEAAELLTSSLREKISELEKRLSVYELPPKEDGSLCGKFPRVADSVNVGDKPDLSLSNTRYPIDDSYTELGKDKQKLLRSAHLNGQRDFYNSIHLPVVKKLEEDQDCAVESLNATIQERNELQDRIEDQESQLSDLQEHLSVLQSWKDSHSKLVAENVKLSAFKVYVHERLDKMNVPFDPEPENNASHGCRIEGRINYLEVQLLQDKETNGKIRKELAGRFKLLVALKRVLNCNDLATAQEYVREALLSTDKKEEKL